MLHKTHYAAAFLCLVASTGVIAAENSNETAFSLAKPARVPGATLKAGHYTIRILDRLPDRYILQVRRQDSSSPLSTFLAVPDEKLPRLSSGTPIYWAKSGHVQAIRGMWVSGAAVGAAFVFPKDEAAKLAKSVGQPVPAVDPDSEGKKEVAKMDDSDRQIVTLWLLSAVAITPEGNKTGIEAAKFVPTAKASMAMAKTDSENSRTEIASAQTPVGRETPATPAKMPKTADNFAGELLGGFILVSAGLSIAKRYGSVRATGRG